MATARALVVTRTVVSLVLLGAATSSAKAALLRTLAEPVRSFFCTIYIKLTPQIDVAGGGGDSMSGDSEGGDA